MKLLTHVLARSHEPALGVVIPSPKIMPLQAERRSGILEMLTRARTSTRESKVESSRISVGHCLIFSSLLAFGGGSVAQIMPNKITSSESGALNASGTSVVASALSRLSDVQHVARVRLFMVVQFIETPVALTPEQLISTGCSFETTRADAKAGLVTLFQQAHFVATQASGREPRRLVIFDFLDGQETRIEFDTAFPKDDVLFGKIDGVSIKADKKLGGEIIEWARNLSERSQCSAHLDSYK